MNDENKKIKYFGIKHYKVKILNHKYNKKIIFNYYIVIVFLFLFSCFLFGRTYAYKNKLVEYNVDNINENSFNKLEYNTEYYYSKNNNEISISKDIAASSLVSCIKSDLDLEYINDDIKDKINDLNNLFNASDNYFSFIYKDIYTGFTVSYNADAPIFTASTIKAPAMIYLYEMASLGKIDLNEELVYDGRFYSDGSGVLKDKELNTSYSVDTLINYAIHYSDNIAYAMLVNRFGRSNILSLWKEKETKNIFTYDTIWGITSASDASIYMQELYNFYVSNDQYGDKLFEYFTYADWKQITDKNGNYNTANKGGWSDETFHDVAIVFDKNPYILAIFSTTGYSDYNYLFKNTSRLVGELHTSYWKYKLEECNKIKQY